MLTNDGDVPITVSFAFRWPSTQPSVNPDASNGNHQYDVAADLNVPAVETTAKQTVNWTKRVTQHMLRVCVSDLQIMAGEM
ncbi:MAG: hypothetical protein HGA87_06710 [Desulfobulbaceae bacterium]|nr:hypothetical protein [Desulfobulbaceae bacterium]